MKNLIALFSILTSSLAYSHCPGEGSFVGEIVSKSPPQMHVRHCNVQLDIPDDFAPDILFLRSVASFGCDAEQMYQSMKVGQKVVGKVSWHPVGISRVPDKLPGCWPQFEFQGYVVTQIP